jgi:hypothetical protein
MINMCDAYMMIFNWLMGLVRRMIGLIVVENEESESLTVIVE